MSTFDYTYAERQLTPDAEPSVKYQKFYIETPIEDLTVTIADEDTEVSTLTGQIVDPAGDAINEVVVIRMIMYTDDSYDTLDAVLTNVAVTATTGVIAKVIAAGIDLLVKTDATGKFVLAWTDSADGTHSTFAGFILPNGKFVEGGEVVLTAS